MGCSKFKAAPFWELLKAQWFLQLLGKPESGLFSPSRKDQALLPKELTAS